MRQNEVSDAQPGSFRYRTALGMQVFLPGSRTFQKSPAGLCPFLRHLTATACLSVVRPGSLGLTVHGDVRAEESALGLPVAESRDFWEILRVRCGVKGQGSKRREDAWMGPQTGVCPSPLGTQPEEPKRAQIGRFPSAKTQRELCPLSGLSKGVPSHPSSGHPWHPQLRGLACQCAHAYPTPENLCYKTGSSRCQPSPISSGPLQPGSRGGGELPSPAGPGWLFRGLPFGPWAEAFPGGPYL